MRVKNKLILLAAAGVGVWLLGSVVLARIYVFPILMYHMVYPDAPYEHRLAVSEKTFERQMRFLKTHKYNVVPLSQVPALLAPGAKVPARSLAITFDDGYKDNYTWAFPILKKYGIPVTVFLIYDEVGRKDNDRLYWEQIKEMHSSGLVTFGSHTLGPVPLVKLPPEEARRQIFESKRKFEEKLGVPVEMFSYPEGMFTPEIVQMVKDAGYTLAVATKPGRRYARDDLFLLKRVRIAENAGNLLVFWFESSGYYSFFKEWRRKK
jgi:peptidoglycan/xylan/chitin deacetylase (PgdA/CDA1 family)